MSKSKPKSDDELTLTDLFARVPDNYEWLIRSSENGLFFSNLIFKGYIQVIGRPEPEGVHFPKWADAPEGALKMSIDECRRWLTKRN